MGYPMTYQRVLSRNHLHHGDYETSALEGDLRRLEKDQQDNCHVHWYARVSGATEEQVAKILKLFFKGPQWHKEDWMTVEDYEANKPQDWQI